MLHFRPFWKLTFASAVLFAILLSLGFWQLNRLQWKLDLISRVNARLHATPVSLDDGGTPYWEPANDYKRISLTGRFDNSKEVYVFGTDKEGAPVYHVIVPFRMNDSRVFLIDRGIVPKEKINPATRRAGQIEGVTRVVGVWRTPDGPGSLTPAPDLTHRIFYAHDLAAIAKLDGVELIGPTIEADATPNPGGWPKGGQTVVTFRNEHLQYAITWFGLAAVLMGVYIAYHVSHGRLRIGR
jgi:surfeit locus 1 family protein